MVYEPLGVSLYDLVKKNDYKRFPLELVRSVSYQILQGIDFLKSINLIHTGKFELFDCVFLVVYNIFCRRPQT
jgi:hypothetical protein